MTANKKKSETKDKAENGDEQPELIEIESQNEIDFPYNKRTRESWEALGLEVPDVVDGEERRFLGLVNTEEDKGGPIQREVTRIVRLRARDYESGNRMLMKEYVYYLENWYGRSWLGEDIAPVADHIEGYYMQQESKKQVERDLKTGKLLPAKFKRSGEHPLYYIPFSKEKVDEIIGDRDKDSIIYTIKFPAAIGSGGYGIRNNFTYDHFVNLSLEDAFKLNAKAGGSSMNPLTSANALREAGIT